MKLFLKLFMATLVAVTLTACGNGSSSSSSLTSDGTSSTSGGTSSTSGGASSTSGGTVDNNETDDNETNGNSGAVDASTILPPA